MQKAASDQPLAELIRDMYLERVSLLMRHEDVAQVIPGYDHVLTLTPTSSGEFTIVCNEFCGIGHDRMVGKILVED